MHKQLLSKVTHIALLKVHPHTLLQRKFSIGLTLFCIRRHMKYFNLERLIKGWADVI